LCITIAKQIKEAFWKSGLKPTAIPSNKECTPKPMMRTKGLRFSKIPGLWLITWIFYVWFNGTPVKAGSILFLSTKWSIIFA
jgi:hypothetical protein